jgi:hypothetical protein
MAERGMIFSAPMVRALLAGTKSQTRRVAEGGRTRAARGWRIPRRLLRHQLHGGSE